MFGRKKKQPFPQIDTAGKEPMIRSSICTGEKTVGFADRKTGAFEEVGVLKDEEDKKKFLDFYGLKEEDLKTFY